MGALLGHVGVDLRPDPEFGKVDPRLNGEPDAWDDLPGIVGLEPIQVYCLAVDLVADAVSQPVGEILPVALLGYVLTGDRICLPPLDGDPLLE